MIGVAQFFARDIPEIPYPDNTDLLQVLWCPAKHQQEDLWGPVVRLIWRRTADLATVPTETHGPGFTAPYPSSVSLADDDYLPRPCVLHPERVTEYPDCEELPEDLQSALNEWDRANSDYQYLLSIAPGCKIGGWETWHLTDMYELPCTTCGTETEPLLQLDTTEWDGGSGPRWQPLEDRDHAPVDWEDEPTSLVLGRWGRLTVFLCPVSAEHGFRMAMQ
ncbi:hypothetical protein [Planotetraspora silvatica]|nr:hypothetical protein [Planotetraspora silvatica]